VQVYRAHGQPLLASSSPVLSTSPVNQQRSSFIYNCPSNTWLNSVKYYVLGTATTQYDSYYTFGCVTLVGSGYGTCSVSSNTDENASFDYMAPTGTMITGISSSFGTVDRIYNFTTCTPTGSYVDYNSCAYSIQQNLAGIDSFHFGCPDRSALVRVTGSVDTFLRLWKFECCRLRAPAGSAMAAQNFNQFGDIIFPNSQNTPQLFSANEAGPDASITRDLTTIQNNVNSYGNSMIAPPNGLQLLFSGLSPPMYIWGPLCPTNYGAVGLVVTTTATQPLNTVVQCVHTRCLSGCQPVNPLFTSTSPYLKLYTKVSANGDYDLGTFAISTDSLGQTFNSQYLNCLKPYCLSPPLNVTAANYQINTYWNQKSLSCDLTSNTCNVQPVAQVVASSPATTPVGLIVGLVVMFVVLLFIVLCVSFMVVGKRRTGQWPIVHRFRRGASESKIGLESSTYRGSGVNPFSSSSSGISGPMEVVHKTHVVHDVTGNFVIEKAPTVGAACIALYSGDQQYYNAIIEIVEPRRCMVRWADFDGNKEWISRDFIRVPSNTI